MQSFPWQAARVSLATVWAARTRRTRKDMRTCIMRWVVKAWNWLERESVRFQCLASWYPRCTPARIREVISSLNLHIQCEP
ncbi:hypothetical protein BKA62DRAFT_711967 [Auriculariales sp. MPI-PUGE-AT-0066]|nr:hypothetical protein BKA62DRAFT_711967 [Auriculariales sp. MPI-PUGE-AT-0066]